MSAEKKRRRLLNAVVAVLSAMVAAGFLVIAELALRRIDPAPPDLEYERFLEQSLGFLEPCPQLAALNDAASGQPRIVVLGESSGQHMGDALSRLVSEGAPAQIANCAQGGAALAHVASRFDAAVAAHPDAIVIVFGHNYQFEPMSRWQIELQYLRLRSRLMSLTSNLLLPPLPRMAERKPRDLAAFEAFLRRAARQCRERGIRLVLTTMTSNYFYPPTTSPNVPPAILEIRLLRMTRPAEATRRLAEIAAADNAAAAFELGVWLDQDGDRDGARAALERALVLDTARFRAVGAQAEMIRRVAGEEGVALRDTARRFAADAPDGITGWESVADNCHLHLDLFVDEAVAVLDLLGVPPPVRDKKVEQIDDDHFGSVLRYLNMRLAAALSSEGQWLLVAPIWRFVRLDEPRIEQRLDEWIEERVRANPENADSVRAGVLNASAQAHWLAGKREQAQALNQRARAASPTAALPWVWKGLYDVADGHVDAARTAFAKALEIEPGRNDARIYLEQVEQSPR